MKDRLSVVLFVFCMIVDFVRVEINFQIAHPIIVLLLIFYFLPCFDSQTDSNRLTELPSSIGELTSLQKLYLREYSGERPSISSSLCILHDH